jgi:hypothetical protein
MPKFKVYVTKDPEGRVMKKVPQSRIGGFRVWQHLINPEPYEAYLERLKNDVDCKVVEVPYTGQQVGDE